MLDNNTYNLMSQMVEEHRGLWRIRNQYQKDASDSGCKACIDFWNKLAREKERDVKQLQELIKDHLE